MLKGFKKNIIEIRGGNVMKRVLSAILSSFFLLGCTASLTAEKDDRFSGFLGDPSVYERLVPGPEGGVALRWVKEGAALKTYDKFMVDSVIFFLADQADYKGIDPQEMKELADGFNKEIVTAFGDRYPIVAEPGPGVARIRIAITKIEPSHPGRSAITTIIPVGLGVSIVKKGTTGGWTGSGETGMELMALDSLSGEIVALAVDRQKAAFESRFSKWGAAGDAFTFWSKRIVSFLDGVRGVGQEPGR